MTNDRSPPRRAGKVSAHDVARMAGVSQSAVSRAFSNAGGISQDTRKHILQVADSLNYRPNALARGLIMNRSGIVGIVVSNLANPFLADVLARLLQSLQAAERKALVLSVNDGADMDKAATGLSQYQVEGCIVISPHLSKHLARSFSRLGRTVLLFNRKVPGLSASTISVDDKAAGTAVADHLLARGHRRVAYLHGMRDATTDNDRYHGFRTRLLQAGMPEPVVGWGGYTYDEAFSAVGGMLARNNPPTAIFCANDAMGMGVMDAARHHLGLRVPEDLAVVGFDDAPSAAWPSYAMTTVRQPVTMAVEAGIDAVLRPEAGGDGHLTNLLLDAELVVRRST